MDWNLTDAKNRLSEVLTRAASEGPQTIHRKREDFVVIPKAQYEELIGERPSFTDWLLNGPRIDDLDLPSRADSPMREIKL